MSRAGSVRRHARPASFGATLAAVVLAGACTTTPPAPVATGSSSAAGSTSTTSTAGASGTATPNVSVTAANSNGGGISPDTAFSVLTAATMTSPAPVKGSDGKTHLAYELLLTDAAPGPYTIDSVEIRDASTHTVVQTVSGATLTADLTPVAGGASSEGVTQAPQAAAPVTPGSTSVLWLDVTLPDASPVPARLEHRIVGSLTPPSGTKVPVEMVIGQVDVSTQAPPVLSWPVPAGDWYMSDGCCADDTHHRRGIAPINGQFMVPQRFAIDLYMLDSEHRAWVGDPSKVESYLSYRKPITAAAAGTVVAAQDGLPNSSAQPQPPPIPKITDTVGNHVIVQIGPGQYVLYAHMDPGSVKVKVGQQVAKGDQLGLIGTSGNSTVPHLHFQLLSTPTFFPTDSRPFVMDSFELTGRVTQRIWDDVMGLQPNGTMPFEAASPGGLRTDEMPLDRAVVRVSS